MALPFSRFAEYFIAVAKTGSLRKAADQLFISVSAVQRFIREISNRLVYRA